MEIMKIRERRLEMESQVAAEQTRQNGQLLKVVMAQLMGSAGTGSSNSGEDGDWFSSGVAEEYYE
jgi:hypothetical protein